MENKFEVSYSLMETICELNSCMELQKDKVKGVFSYKGMFLICVGTCSSYNEGWISANCFEFVPLELYCDPKEPMFETEHVYAVNQGTRERGYPGRKFWYGNKLMVIRPEGYCFTPLSKEKFEQLHLF